eukprot:2657123-Rhodomonas_salina.7
MSVVEGWVAAHGGHVTQSTGDVFLQATFVTLLMGYVDDFAVFLHCTSTGVVVNVQSQVPFSPSPPHRGSVLAIPFLFAAALELRPRQHSFACAGLTMAVMQSRIGKADLGANINRVSSLLKVVTRPANHTRY